MFSEFLRLLSLVIITKPPSEQLRSLSNSTASRLNLFFNVSQEEDHLLLHRPTAVPSFMREMVTCPCTTCLHSTCLPSTCLPSRCILSTCNQVIQDREIQDLSDHRCHLSVQGLKDHRLVQGLQDHLLEQGLPDHLSVHGLRDLQDHLSDQDLQDQDSDLDLEVHLQAPLRRKSGFHLQAGLLAVPEDRPSGNGCGL